MKGTIARGHCSRWQEACLVFFASLLPATAASSSLAAEPPASSAPSCPPPLAGTTGAQADPDLAIDLPSVLRLVNAANPTIAVAQARVDEAYYVMRQAQVSWLPDLSTGPAYYRHDGQWQASNGNVFTVSKSNLFEGGAAFFTWDTTNIYFGPLIARRLYQAQTAAAQAVTNDVQLDAVLTYLDLVRVYTALAINADTLARATEMLQLSQQADRAEIGKPWQVSRALTEVEARRTERQDLLGQAGAVAARLARLLLLEPAVQLQPGAPPVVPITLVPEDSNLDNLIALGWDNRPEMRESRLLTDAARYRRQQAVVAPFLPSLQASYAAGVFGGGTNNYMSNFDGRGDGTVMAVWELHNLGAGDVAVARERRAQLEQATFHVTEVQSRVAAQIVEAARFSATRHAALGPAESGVRQGIEMWSRLHRYVKEVGLPARDYNPLELLIAEQQLDQARLLYLTQVIEYNKSQFRLYWAMGQPPLLALPKAAAVPVQEPVVPPTYTPPEANDKGAAEVLPLPRPQEKK